MCEFTGLDFEMAIHEHYDEVLEMIDKLFVYIFEGLRGKFGALSRKRACPSIGLVGVCAGFVGETTQVGLMQCVPTLDCFVEYFLSAKQRSERCTERDRIEYKLHLQNADAARSLWSTE